MAMVEMKSYLSPNVGSLIDIMNSVGTSSRNWRALAAQLSRTDPEENPGDWYGKGAEVFSSFGHWAVEEIPPLLDGRKCCFEWLSQPALFEKVLKRVLIDGGDDVQVLSAVPVLTAVLERSIGDLFYSLTSDEGRPVPALLRDLATSDEVTGALDGELAVLLRSVFGSPKSLNLRNLAWHGFLLPGEVGPSCVAGLGALAHLVGEKLGTDNVKFLKRTMRRSFADLDLPKITLSTLAYLLDSSPRARTVGHCNLLYEEGRYLEATSLLLSELEFLLRSAFARANSCPSRVMTAEDETLYTTLTEILDRELGRNSGEENRLIGLLGTGLVEYLYDVFVMPGGPRIRDRLSHGEVEGGDDEMRTWFLAVRLAYEAVKEKMSGNEQGSDGGVAGALEHRRPLFHPSTVLMAELDRALRSCRQILCRRSYAHLDVLEIDSESFSEELESTESGGDESPASSWGALRAAGYSGETKLQVLSSFLSDFRPATLFRPREEYAALTLLRKVAAQAALFFRQSVETVAEREATLSQLSRRRQESYRKMLLCLGRVSAFWLNAAATSAAFLVTAKRGEVEFADRLTKALRQLLKKCENLVSCTGLDRNDWERAGDIVSDEDILKVLDDIVIAKRVTF